MVKERLNFRKWPSREPLLLQEEVMSAEQPQNGRDTTRLFCGHLDINRFTATGRSRPDKII